MRYTQSNIRSAIRAIQQFVAENAAALGDIPTGQARARVAETGQRLDEHAETQAERNYATRMATRRRVELRASLIRDHMQPIAYIARLVSSQVPELAALTMPRRHSTDDALVVRARAMADAASGHADQFCAGGLHTDFVAQLEAAADALIAAVTERRLHRASRVAATQGLQEESRIALARMKILNTFIRRQVRNDEALAAKWDTARRVLKKTGGVRVVADTPAADIGASYTTVTPSSESSASSARSTRMTLSTSALS